LNKKVDCIIIGQGIAGTWLAFQLIKQNKTVLIVDERNSNSSSRVAGGIYNPLIPKRQRLAYLAQEIYPSLRNEYHELEQFINEKVLFESPIHYILESQSDYNNWATLSQTEPFNQFVKLKDESLSPNILSPFGVIEILNSGWVNIPLLLDTFSKRIVAPNYFLNQTFDEDLLQNNDGKFQYLDFEANAIVYCVGNQIKYLKHLENIVLKPAKGEVLTVQLNESFSNLIPQQGIFMLPINEQTFRIGSTFEWNDLTDAATEKGKAEILNKWQNYYKGDFNIIEHKAGIRPSSKDRKPLLGRIKPQQNIYIFNGLGSKGVALAPHFSKMLIDNILQQKAIDQDVDVQRLFKNG
jgi:glycine oxidase